MGDSGTVSRGGKEAAREQLERGLGHSEVTGSHRTALESIRQLLRVTEESNEGAMCVGRRGQLDTTLLSPSLVAKKALSSKLFSMAGPPNNIPDRKSVV